MQSDIEAIILLHRLLDNVSSFITFCGLPIYSLYVPNCWGPFRVSINVRRQRRPAMCLYSLLITFYFFSYIPASCDCSQAWCRELRAWY